MKREKKIFKVVVKDLLTGRTVKEGNKFAVSEKQAISFMKYTMGIDNYNKFQPYNYGGKGEYTFQAMEM